MLSYENEDSKCRAEALTLSLARMAHRLEKLIDRFREPVPATNPAIDTYTGFSTPSGVVVRGRVLSQKQRKLAIKQPSILANMLAMARNFATDEIVNVRVAAGGVQTQTDEEGYFALTVPRDRVPDTGRITVRLPDHQVEADATVIIVEENASFGVISDIDDTVIRTGAWALYRNIWTTFTKSASARHVHTDSCILLDKLHGGVNPVFYVSSSPWNLHTYLTDVFAQNDITPGPLFLRDLGISDTKFIKGSHGEHKGRAIDTIMTANPQLDFVLIGDTGQHDASVYLSAANRHGSKVKLVILRAAGKLDEDDAKDVQALMDAGISCFVGETLDEAPVPDFPASKNCRRIDD